MGEKDGLELLYQKQDGRGIIIIVNGKFSDKEIPNLDKLLKTCQNFKPKIVKTIFGIGIKCPLTNQVSQDNFRDEIGEFYKTVIKRVPPSKPGKPPG